jgi:hypothetical protein
MSVVVDTLRGIVVLHLKIGPSSNNRYFLDNAMRNPHGLSETGKHYSK